MEKKEQCTLLFVCSFFIVVLPGKSKHNKRQFNRIVITSPPFIFTTLELDCHVIIMVSFEILMRNTFDRVRCTILKFIVHIHVTFQVKNQF